MDREAWRATVHGVTKNQIQLSDFHTIPWFDFSMFYLTNCLDIQAFQIFAIKNPAEMNIITQDPCTILKYFLKEGIPGREIAESKGYV